MFLNKSGLLIRADFPILPRDGFLKLLQKINRFLEAGNQGTSEFISKPYLPYVTNEAVFSPKYPDLVLKA